MTDDFEPWEIDMLKKVAEHWFDTRVRPNLLIMAYNNVAAHVTAGEEGYGMELNQYGMAVITDYKLYDARVDEEYERLVAQWKETRI